MANESKRNSSGLALRSSRREMEAEGFETTKIIVEEDDDDPPMLSSQALEALKEFMNEQQSIVDESVEIESSEVALVAEDWRLSQFWYDRETAAAVAEEVRNLSLITASPVACIACPTLYAYLKKYYPDISVQLLEYDKRFEQYGRDFTYYDYNQPKELPLEMRHGYRVIIADPPYLSKECLEKVAETMTYLAQPGECYLLLLTGEVQRERAAEILNLYPCGFRPQHSSKLGNDFRLFTNYDPRERLGGWERD
ncbi:EEF1A lysine methyltransferase 1 [Macadamia integrifolia]|uniref:EEF1A lysine methyltransferase 1 n=1 Tax=Macadamia integrifolia TaxID=60698 RepID=UPI001C4F2A80|nr:EEF1A lysine methyltransferase 1 [Macadamia integrifolia]